MGLFELIFESINPGNIGSIEKKQKRPQRVSLIVLVVKLIVSFVIIFMVYSVTIKNNLNVKNIIVFIVLLTTYCLIGYNFVPKPDYTNVGWFGGLMDNPLRYSDDINRMLIFLLILLYPGRFISFTLVQSVDFLKERANKNKEHLN